MSEINVTPFVDVMLVLLIVFMVAAPLLNVSVPIDLPETKAEQTPGEKEDPITITVDVDGKMYIGDGEVNGHTRVKIERHCTNHDNPKPTPWTSGSGCVATRASITAWSCR